MLYFVIPKLFTKTYGSAKAVESIKNITPPKGKVFSKSEEFSFSADIVPITNLQKVSKDKLPYYLQNDKGEFDLKNKVKSVQNVADLEKPFFGKKRLLSNFKVEFEHSFGSPYKITPKFKSPKYVNTNLSMYFFEQGKMTYGINPQVDTKIIEDTFVKIEKRANELAKEVQAKKKKAEEAREELRRFIELNNPIVFYNTMMLPKGGVVDKLKHGIGFSLEGDDFQIPDGNIVFKVSEDFDEEKAYINGFGNGIIESDGSLPKVDVKNYFKYLTTNRVHNTTEGIVKERIKMKDLKNWKMNKIFKTPTYQTDELIVTGKEYKIDKFGFRHLFVRSGNGEVIIEGEKYPVYEGCSYIVSSEMEIFAIKNTAKKNKEGERERLRVLLTYAGNHQFWDAPKTSIG